MLNYAKHRLNKLLGRGEFAVTIPVMDGPFLPNQFLEQGELVFEADELDNLCEAEGQVYYSSGQTVLGRSIDDLGAKPDVVHLSDTAISALSAFGDALAIGLDGKGVKIKGGPYDGTIIETVNGGRLNCVTSVLFLSADEIVVANGSAIYEASRWKFDLIQLGHTGSVWRVDLKSGKAHLLAQGLAFPYGMALAPDNAIYVSECWKHRIVKLPAGGGKPELVSGNLPGYPSRIAPTGDGRYLLTFLSARNQLYEFVLREREYCQRMMDEIDPDYWMAPALKSNLSFKEQIQGDSVKMMGVLKPWAPPRSYGLVALCNAQMEPLVSWHSRADGINHGTTSVIVRPGSFMVNAKGMGRAVEVKLEHPELEEVSK